MMKIKSDTCPRCSECIGELHHWMVSIADVDNETGEVTIPCKHCEATTMGVDCDLCGDVAPQATSLEKDGRYTCADCLTGMI